MYARGVFHRSQYFNVRVNVVLQYFERVTATEVGMYVWFCIGALWQQKAEPKPTLNPLPGFDGKLKSRNASDQGPNVQAFGKVFQED